MPAAAPDPEAEFRRLLIAVAEAVEADPDRFNAVVAAAVDGVQSANRALRKEMAAVRLGMVAATVLAAPGRGNKPDPKLYNALVARAFADRAARGCELSLQEQDVLRRALAGATERTRKPKPVKRR